MTWDFWEEKLLKILKNRNSFNLLGKKKCAERSFFFTIFMARKDNQEKLHFNPCNRNQLII